MMQPRRQPRTRPAPPPAPAGETVTLQITDVGYRGLGVARVDGKVVFCPRTLIGERVQAQITGSHRNFAHALPLHIEAPSPHRIAPACPLAASCPGCAYQEAAYEEELRLKSAQLTGFLRRVPTFTAAPPLTVDASPLPLGYRNKLVLHAQRDAAGLRLGYVGSDNQRVLDVPACPLAMPAINTRLQQLRADPSFLASLNDDTRLTLRYTEQDGVVHWSGFAGSDAAPLTEASPAGPLTVPRGGFFQVNAAAAARLIARVQAILRQCRPEALIDAYCGVGVFALAARQAGVPQIIGTDADAAAIDSARENARRLGATDLSFTALPAERGIADALARCQNAAHTALLVDPPRTGLPPPVIALLLKAAPATILYVSCAPDTLARDLNQLCAERYRLAQGALIDMFPRTAHFETLILLQRRDGATPFPASLHSGSIGASIPP